MHLYGIAMINGMQGESLLDRWDVYKSSCEWLMNEHYLA